MAMSIKFGDNESYYYDCGFCRCFLFLLYAIVYTNMYFFTSRFSETALRCSGLDWQAIETCVRWMKPFFNVISNKAPYLQLNEQNEQVTNKFGLAHICPNIVTDDSHIIQTHTTTMDMYVSILSSYYWCIRFRMQY